MLYEIQDKQRELGIQTEFIICKRNGDCIHTEAYDTALRRLCESLGFYITNNHAFRMSLNSLFLIPAGFPVTERAAMLGHSVETNLAHYSYDPRVTQEDKVTRMNTFNKNKHSGTKVCPERIHHE